MSAPSSMKWMAMEFAAGAGAAVVAVPVALLAGAGVGSLSSNTALAAVPALLLFLALPPLAVAGLEAWLGNRLSPGRGLFRPAVWGALAVHALCLGAAVVLGASAHNWGDAALLTLAEAVALAAAATLTMQWTFRERVRRGEPPLPLGEGWGEARPQPSPSPRAKEPDLPTRLLPATLLLCAAALSAAGPASAACPERASWPTQGWSARPLAPTPARAGALKAFEDYAFTLTGKDEERKGIRTDAVVIIHRGAVVYERYARGYAEGRRHLGWSMSKSAINALTGLAVERKLLSLEDSICEYVKPTREEACAIQVGHLLEFASGLDWRETYEGQSNQASSVLAMLYGEGQRDMVGFITSHALRDAPGTSWAYSSGDTTLLAGVLKGAQRQAADGDWPFLLLRDLLGMRTAVWERDGKGVPVGSSYLYATPRDWAKLGFLFLNDGCWENARVLPEGWVAASTTPSEALKRKPLARRDGDVQGRQLWLNRRVPGLQETLPWPHVPEGAYALRGHWGQSVSVIPSKELVVVRLADDREGGAFVLDTFLERAMALVEAP